MTTEVCLHLVAHELVLVEELVKDAVEIGALLGGDVGVVGARLVCLVVVEIAVFRV